MITTIKYNSNHPITNPSDIRASFFETKHNFWVNEKKHLDAALLSISIFPREICMIISDFVFQVPELQSCLSGPNNPQTIRRKQLQQNLNGDEFGVHFPERVVIHGIPVWDPCANEYYQDDPDDKCIKTPCARLCVGSRCMGGDEYILRSRSIHFWIASCCCICVCLALIAYIIYAFVI